MARIQTKYLNFSQWEHSAVNIDQSPSIPSFTANFILLDFLHKYGTMDASVFRCSVTLWLMPVLILVNSLSVTGKDLRYWSLSFPAKKLPAEKWCIINTDMVTCNSTHLTRLKANHAINKVTIVRWIYNLALGWTDLASLIFGCAFVRLDLIHFESSHYLGFVL